MTISVRTVDCKADMAALYPLYAEFGDHQQCYDRSEACLTTLIETERVTLFLAFMKTTKAAPHPEDTAVPNNRERKHSNEDNPDPTTATRPGVAAHTRSATKNSTGSPAGFAAIHPGYTLEQKKWYTFLESLYVIDRLRGSGIGKKLMARVAQHARDHGMPEIHYKVSTLNPDLSSTLQFYTRLGARESLEHVSFILEPAKMRDLLRQPGSGVRNPHNRKSGITLRPVKPESETDSRSCCNLLEWDMGERGVSQWTIQMDEVRQLLSSETGCRCSLMSIDGDAVPEHAANDYSRSTAGCALFVAEGDPFYGNTMALEAFYIRPEFRRSGLGTKMFNELVLFAERHGFTQIATWRCRTDNNAGIRFLKKVGATHGAKWGFRDFWIDENSVEQLAEK